ncbi:hypothetical protein G7Y79_00032g067560 [Physcia stellaris]|nr:hypothetical protein G7Y79_00032g067560 [Physcia stellaris]
MRSLPQYPILLPRCQRADWRAHKSTCHTPQVWYDAHRRCEDGANHEGRLELITWPSLAADTGDEEDLGWGACFAEESEDLKHKFETEYEGDEEKWYHYWPQGFRWTCCGTAGDQMFGCDHHGSGSRACTCDFCHMGKPLPDDIYSKTVRSPSAKGLKLLKGPDPRSFNPAKAGVAAMARGIIGMDRSGL